MRVRRMKPGRARAGAGHPGSRRFARALGFAGVTLLLALGSVLGGVAHAEEPGGASAAVETLAPNPGFAHFPSFEGTLGKRRIVLRLGAKPDDPTGVHGEYQFADTGEVVLVAGDRENDTLEIEESNDGTAITGNWVGRFSADGSLAGERMNVDDSDPQPFDLHPRQAVHSSTN